MANPVSMFRQASSGALSRFCSRSLRPSRQVSQRHFSFSPQQSAKAREPESLDLGRLTKRRKDYDQRRVAFLMAGVVAGVLLIGYTAWNLKIALDDPLKCDSGPLTSTGSLTGVDGSKRKVVVHNDDGQEIVPTGNTTVPDFPRTIDIPDFGATTATPASEIVLVVPGAAGPATTQYTLVGLGLRTVSFLGIQVYVVGFYVATSDIAALQSRLIKKINPLATALVSGEKDQLRKALSDPVQGEEMWDELLKEGIPARSLFRVVPVRDTDFHHLRDGFVRAVQARTKQLSSTSAMFSQLPCLGV